MRIYTTDIPRDSNGVMQYEKQLLVDIIDLRYQKTTIKRPGSEDEQIDATLVSGRELPEGQCLYFESYDAANLDPKKIHAIFTIRSRSDSAIGRHQYRLQFKEFDAA
jgi:hypothetical protein